MWTCVCVSQTERESADDHMRELRKIMQEECHFFHVCTQVIIISIVCKSDCTHIGNECTCDRHTVHRPEVIKFMLLNFKCL